MSILSSCSGLETDVTKRSLEVSPIPIWEARYCLLNSIENMSFEISDLMFAASKHVQTLTDSLQLDTIGYTMSNRCTDEDGLVHMIAQKTCLPRQA